MVRQINRAYRYSQALLLAVGLAGCAQLLGGNAELVQKRFYTINTERLGNSLENSERPYAFRVQIKGFEAPRAYDRSEIIIRRDQYELQLDKLHNWMERPSDMFTDRIKQYLRQANLFTHIGGDRDFWDHRPDYTLTGTIKAIERFDSDDVWAAHLAMTIELVRQEDGKVIWQKDFDEERTVFFPEMKQTISAFSTIFGQQMEKSMREIDFVFLNNQRVGANGALTGLPILPNGETAPASQDTALLIDTDSNDYKLIPGKLAP